MATNKEFELIKSMYLSAVGQAYRKIEECEKKDAENPNKDIREYGSVLTGLLKRELEEFTEPISWKWSKDYEMIYDKKDALKMLQAIEKINTHIL